MTFWICFVRKSQSGSVYIPMSFVLKIMYIVISRATPSAACPFWLLGVAMWEAWCLLFGTPEIILTSEAPRGSILAARDNLGEPWELQDGHEVVQNRIFIDLGILLGPMHISFLTSWSMVVKKRTTPNPAALMPLAGRGRRILPKNIVKACCRGRGTNE